MKLNVQQQLAVEKIDRSMCISAGAGSGKTKVLVERFWALVQSGIDIDGILVVTFTRKAAAELIERIRQKVEESPLSYIEKTRLKEKLSHAWIGTIHSACSRILRENPVESGVAPDFNIMEENEALQLREKTAVKVVIDAVTEQQDGVLEYIEVYGKNQLLRELQAITGLVFDRGLSLTDLRQQTLVSLDEQRLLIPRMAQQVEAALNQAALNLSAINPKTKTYTILQQIAENKDNWIAKLGELKSNESYAEFLNGIVTLCKGNLARPARDAIIQLREAVEELWDCRAEMDIVPWVETLFDLLQRVERQVEAVKAEQGLLEYNDLEEKTLHLLRDNSRVAEKYRSIFRHIMVDEFQDTNCRQVEIIKLLSQDNQQKQTFVVGDPKQSIYRFRGAQVELFSQVDSDLNSEGGISHRLDSNYRTRPQLVEFINRLFIRLMPSAGGSSYQELSPQRARGKDYSHVELHLLETDKEAKLDQVEAEAHCLAQRIKNMTSGELLVYRGQSGEDTASPVNYADIALLFKTSRDIEAFAAVLSEYSIPCYVVGSRGFFDAEEVLAVLLCLRYADNPQDELSLVGALRCSMFGISDQSLWLMHNSCGSIGESFLSIDSLELPVEEKQKLLLARGVLEEIRKRKYHFSTVDLIDFLLKQTGYEYFLACQPMGSQMLANLNKLKQMALANQQAGQSGLHYFMQQILRSREADVKEQQAAVEEEKGNTVKLMTVHQSKGLEFPVVIIPQLHQQFNLRDVYESALVSNSGIYLKNPLRKGRLRKIAEDIENEKVLDEYKRLLYVAITRARDYLILSGCYSCDSEGKVKANSASWLRWILDIYAAEEESLAQHLQSSRINPFFYKINQIEVYHAGEDAGTAVIPDEKNLPLAPQENIDWTSGIPQRVSASMIVDYNHCPFFAYLKYKWRIPISPVKGNSRDKSKTADGLTPAALGTLIHRVIECSTSLEDARDLAARLVGESGKDSFSQWEELDSMIKNYYQNEKVKQLNNSGRLLKEVSFFARLNSSTIMEGFVDQLWLEERSAHVMDIKTGQDREEILPGKIKTYSIQVNAYQQALQRILGLESVSGSLIFLRSGKIVEIESEEPTWESGCQLVPQWSSSCTSCGYRFICFPD